jgi:DNA polymerase-3 subunit gamma/tau
MAAQALYRKWRPRTFDQIVGQQHVVRTLRNALASESVRHAYLFSGPRGTGKTSMARLLAKAVNCLGPKEKRPCDECSICQAINEGRLLDLIEIDAASNTGVDDVRELRERVGFRPNEARYKVYVIDEVHMLSNAAFNALLKTLEEPPPHAIFVLATTEPQKVPATVVSRCQRFDFRRIAITDIVQRLEWLVEQEEIEAEPEALLLIARHATGSLRDADGLLDQLASYGGDAITAADVRSSLGASTTATVMEVVDALAAQDLARGLGVISSAVDEGTDPRELARQLVEHLRALLLVRLGSSIPPAHVSEDQRERVESQAASLSAGDLSSAIQLFSRAAGEARGGWQPQLPLEMALVQAAITSAADSGAADPPARQEAQPDKRSEAPAKRADDSAAREKTGGYEAAESSPPGEEPAGEETVAQPEPGKPLAAGGPASVGLVRDEWARLLRTLRPQNRSLEALMRSCTPKAVDGDVVVLSFAHSFHRDKVQEDQNKRVVEDALSELLGSQCRIRCVLDSALADSKAGSEPDAAGSVDEAEQDPVVRAAVEDLGAQVVSSPE